MHEHKVIGFIGFVAVGDNRRANFNPGTGVDVLYRNRGIGKVLVSVWINEVKAMGAEECLISTGINNYPAQRVYCDRGFKNVGEFCGLVKSANSTRSIKTQ